MNLFYFIFFKANFTVLGFAVEGLLCAGGFFLANGKCGTGKRQENRMQKDGTKWH